jgi:hypothetical protein
LTGSSSTRRDSIVAAISADCVHERRLRRHRDRFGDGPRLDLERDVEPLAHGDDHSFTHDGGEAGQFHANRVLAGVQVRRAIQALFVGDDDDCRRRTSAGHRHGHARNGGAA